MQRSPLSPTTPTHAARCEQFRIRRCAPCADHNARGQRPALRRGPSPVYSPSIHHTHKVMARADLIVNLVRAGTQGDQKLFRSTVEALAAEERAKRHTQLADKLEENLRAAVTPQRATEVVRSFDGGHGGLLYEIVPRRPLDAMLLPQDVEGAVRELIEEQHRRDLLRSYGLEPRHRVLLSGPPGNGKTTLAEAIAYELMVPLFVVRYEAVVGSFLGETSGRLKRLFDFARTHNCVLFLTSSTRWERSAETRMKPVKSSEWLVLCYCK
ncbi:ATPase family associated with various cellular activities (AAA) [Burkholderia sp. D7]|nr:ATPase family associated with various cellular activities (AAA) [Burkholderia sp. D7]